MIPGNTQQEVLFFTGTTFAQTELQSNDPSGCAQITLADQLENAFWNGLLFEMLPELKEENTDLKNLFLWQINNYAASMCISMGNSPEPVDQQFSVDPHRFLQTTFFN